jgi:ATP-binding cassette subfamily F protein uup
LDIDTLELLEQRLAEFDGTVFLVSHDRRFLDQVVTSTLVYEGLGDWREYEGGVEDWMLQSKRLHGAAPVWHIREAAYAKASGADGGIAPDAGGSAAITADTQVVAQPLTKRKLSYKEQRELDSLPARIDALEAEQRDIDNALADVNLYVTDHVKAVGLASRREAIEAELMAALERWEALGGG